MGAVFSINMSKEYKSKCLLEMQKMDVILKE